MSHRIPVLLVVLASLVAACSGDGADDGPRVVATTSILGDIVGEVVGDAATVEVLLPIGADPHDFTPSSAQVAVIETADLVVANGLGLEAGLEDVLAAATAGGTEVLEVGPLVDPLDFDGDPCDVDDAGGDDHAHGACDPHVWMDPIRAAAIAAAVAGSLADDLPGDWEANAADYAASMTAVDAEIRDLLAAVPDDRRTLVTNHDSLGYFAQRYDFAVVGSIVPGGSTLAEPSSRELAELVATMRAEGVEVVFAETTEPTALADALAAELGEGARVVELYTGSLGGPDSGAETLADMLVVDARLIADALG